MATRGNLNRYFFIDYHKVNFFPCYAIFFSCSHDSAGIHLSPKEPPAGVAGMTNWNHPIPLNYTNPLASYVYSSDASYSYNVLQWND